MFLKQTFRFRFGYFSYRGRHMVLTSMTAIVNNASSTMFDYTLLKHTLSLREKRHIAAYTFDLTQKYNIGLAG